MTLGSEGELAGKTKDYDWVWILGNKTLVKIIIVTIIMVISRRIIITLVWILLLILLILLLLLLLSNKNIIENNISKENKITHSESIDQSNCDNFFKSKTLLNGWLLLKQGGQTRITSVGLKMKTEQFIPSAITKAQTIGIKKCSEA